jgi:hypothetical protein
VIAVINVFLLSITLIVNKVGYRGKAVLEDGSLQEEDEALCAPIGLNNWYILLTSTVLFKLLVMIARYHLFKKQRQENIYAFMVDLVITNIALTGVFVKAYFMYFSEHNLCSFVDDPLTKMSYQIFCGIILIGYLQFVWCILLSCYLPLSAFIIYQLVAHRLT